jgi:hypothetical protein
MKSTPEQSTSPGSLTRDHWDVPIRVRLLPFVEFSHRLDEELESLVTQWLDKSAPCARKSERGR